MPSSAAPIRAVIFDLDETLIVDDSGARQALTRAAQRAVSVDDVEAARLAASIVRCARALWRTLPLWAWANGIGISSREALVARFDHPGPEWEALREGQPDYCRTVYATALAEHGHEPGARVDALAEAFRQEHLAHRTPLPGALDALRALRPHLRIGMLTNGVPDLQRSKVAAAGLAPWFDAIVVSGEVGAGKPEERVFRHALSALKATPDETVMVGDNLERDILGAHRVGMRSIWIDRTPGPADLEPLATWRVGAIADVPPLLTP